MKQIDKDGLKIGCSLLIIICLCLSIALFNNNIEQFIRQFIPGGILV